MCDLVQKILEQRRLYDTPHTKHEYDLLGEVAERIEWHRDLDKARCESLLNLTEECTEAKASIEELHKELLAAKTRIEELERELNENWNNYVSMAAQAKLRLKSLHATVVKIAESNVRPQTAAYELQQIARRALDHDLKLLVKK